MNPVPHYFFIRKLGYKPCDAWRIAMHWASVATEFLQPQGVKP